ncbi:MAG TPA: hypothetical protein VKR26_17080 [Terriglobales bacterium]|nr:hypothetical protein [Terriglobales bacterium]
MLAAIVVIVVGVTGFIGSAKEKRRSLPEQGRLRLLLLTSVPVANGPAKSSAGQYGEGKVQGGGVFYSRRNGSRLLGYRRGRGTSFRVDDHFTPQARFHSSRLFLR